ncbi:MAG: hypothetical protein M1818_001731 [Claussenomyces sp. TS43310]|nr:MAG: hypothetical protein M1818_001731 [Claussenomyces sp. TS43310]
MAPAAPPALAVKRSKRQQEKEPLKTILDEMKTTEYRNAVVLSSTRKSDSSLIEIFRADLQAMRSLATCTICDQLLYEPWTLGCGHTYCYSCLCSWFTLNKRKKTCPECRNPVKQMPAPAFLLKQMVEVFVNRLELIPPDETADQHQERRREENSIVETDRASEGGLFKGCFNTQPHSNIKYDEGDHVPRCVGCGQEYVGGHACEFCGLDFQGDELEVDFSDGDHSLSGIDFEVDIDHDNEDYESEDDDDEAGFGPVGFYDPQHNILGRGPRHLGGFENDDIDFAAIAGARSDLNNSDSELSDDQDDAGSLRDFIEDDGHEFTRRPQNQYGVEGHSGSSSSPEPVLEGSDNDEESDDDDDDDGPISRSSRRRQRAPRVITISDSNSSSEAEDQDEQARALQQSGWSPLQQGPESDDGHDHKPFMENSEGSDTNTMMGNEAMDEEEDEDDEDEGDDNRYRENGSSTPRYGQSLSPQHRGHVHVHQRSRVSRSESIVTSTSNDSRGSYGYSDIEATGTSVVDDEGDVEMSVSPSASRRSSSYSNDSSRASQERAEILGSVNVVHEIEDDSSDGSIQPAVRRRPRAVYQRRLRRPDYDPRISRMLAQHQTDIRDALIQQNPFYEEAMLRSYNPRNDAGPRSRTHSAYRVLPPPRWQAPVAGTQASLAARFTPAFERHRIIRQTGQRYFV